MFIYLFEVAFESLYTFYFTVYVLKLSVFDSPTLPVLFYFWNGHFDVSPDKIEMIDHLDEVFHTSRNNAKEGKSKEES